MACALSGVKAALAVADSPA